MNLKIRRINWKVLWIFLLGVIAAFGCIAPLTLIGCLLLDIPLMYFYKMAVMFTIIYIVVDIFFE